MSKKSYELWIEDHKYGNSYLIPKEEISQEVSLFDEYCYVVEGLPLDEETEDQIRKLAAEIAECEDTDKVKDLLEQKFKVDNITVSIADDYIDTERQCYLLPVRDDDYSAWFITPADCESCPVYNYWDGSNWTKLWHDENNMARYKLVIDEDSGVCLDTWDGSNWNYNGKFNHGNIYAILELDGEEVENTYLFEQYTQYQGDIPSGKIIYQTEYEELIQDIEN